MRLRNKNRSFVGWGREDFKDYYQKNYVGMTPVEIKKEDPSFYKIVLANGFLDIFPHKIETSVYRGWKREDFQRHYEEHYEGMSASEVQDVDKAFYQWVYRKGFSGIFLHKIRSYKGWKREDFQRHYEEHFSGMKPSEIKRADSKFYAVLISRKYTDIIKDRILRSWKGWTKKDFKRFYREKYYGMSPAEVENVDSGFYAIVCKRGFSDIFKCKVISRTIWTKNYCISYYNKNYAGMSPSEVEKIDPAFYSVSKRRGCLEIFKHKRHNYKGWKREDFQRHYEEHYEGMSASEVQDVDRGFYKAAFRRRFSDIFPHKRRSYEGWKREDFQRHYEEHYNGMSSYEIQKVDRSFYQAVRNRGFLSIIRATLPFSINHRNSVFFRMKKKGNCYQNRYSESTKHEILTYICCALISEHIPLYQFALNPVFKESKNKTVELVSTPNIPDVVFINAQGNLERIIDAKCYSNIDVLDIKRFIKQIKRYSNGSVPATLVFDIVSKRTRRLLDTMLKGMGITYTTIDVLESQIPLERRLIYNKIKSKIGEDLSFFRRVNHAIKTAIVDGKELTKTLEESFDEDYGESNLQMGCFIEYERGLFYYAGRLSDIPEHEITLDRKQIKNIQMGDRYYFKKRNGLWNWRTNLNAMGVGVPYRQVRKLKLERILAEAA